MNIVLVNSVFSHNVLFAEFKLHPSCEEYYTIGPNVDFFQYERIDNSDRFDWAQLNSSTGVSQPDSSRLSYIVNVTNGENKALIKVRINVTSDSPIDCSCGIKSDDNGYYVEKYFVDLTDLQDRLLTQIDFGDDCILPNSYISELLKLFTLDVSVQNCSCDIEDIYKKFVLNKRSNTVSKNHNCGCNG